MYLRADTPGVRAEDRQDLRQPDQVRGHSGKALQAEPAASRRVAYPDPRLRLSAARGQGHRGRAALCRHRARRAARPAYAFAHLLDGRAVGGIDRVEPVGASRSSRTIITRRFHGLRAPAARAGRQGQGDDRNKAGGTRRVTGDRARNLGDYTALAAMPARYVLERGDWKGAAALPVDSDQASQADSLTRFTRGLGMARSGDVAGAKREIEAMQGLRAALQKSEQIPTGPTARKSRCWRSPRGSRMRRARASRP